MVSVKKHDFIELEFVGRNLTNNEVFDTNIKEEGKKANLEVNPKPLVVCVGENMVVKGFDESLEGKEIGKKYTVKLAPEKAFGPRKPGLTRMIPIKMFLEQKIMPEAGMTLALDNNLVKVVSVSGGRVLVDFNNPLAGKDVEYDFTITKHITDEKEKVNAVQRFFFGHEFEFDLEEKDGKKKIVFRDLKLAPVLNAFKDKFKEVLGYDLEILEKKKDEKSEKAEKKEAEKK
jgi:FKBP-type peptidyl-prolyl cis-trans isomerase 2